jgi:hypothetical protein
MRRPALARRRLARVRGQAGSEGSRRARRQAVVRVQRRETMFSWVTRVARRAAPRLRRINAFRRRRRLSLLLACCCIASLATLTFGVGRFFRIESRVITIGLYDGDKLRLERGSINISKENQVDKVVIGLNLAGRGAASKGSALSVAVPPDMALASTFSHALIANGTVKNAGTRWYHFQATGESQPACQLVLKGDVITSASRELDLHLLIVADHEFPLNLSISGIDRVDVLSIDPAPAVRNSYMIAYDPLRWNRDQSEIDIQVRDRERGGRVEYGVLVAGVLIGVFSSLLASIGWDMAKETELTRNPKVRGRHSASRLPRGDDN